MTARNHPVEDWSEIQVLARREGVSQREIARRFGISRVTVKRALDSRGPPGYERVPRSSGFDVFETQVVALLRDFPQMPVTVVAQRIGWNMSRVININVICGSHR